jgi:hypothetical protein
MRHALVVAPVSALVAALVLVGCGPAPTTAGPGAAPSATRASTPNPAKPSTSTRTPSAPPRLRVARAGFHLPVALAREAVIVTGHDAVVAGGLLSDDSSVATAYHLDLRSGRVTPMPALPVSVHDTTGAESHGRPLVIGGGNATEQDVVQAWNGHAWRVVGHLPQARSDLVAAPAAGRVVVLGGYDGTRPAEPDILTSSDGVGWKVIGTLPVPVRYAASAAADRAIWVFGGEVDHRMQNAIQRVDPTTGRARVVGRLPIPLGHAVALAFGRRILVAGGRTDPDTVTDRMWWFDPATSGVSRAGRLPEALADSAVARWGERSYLIGGETPTMTRSVLRVTYR